MKVLAAFPISVILVISLLMAASLLFNGGCKTLDAILPSDHKGKEEIPQTETKAEAPPPEIVEVRVIQKSKVADLFRYLSHIQELPADQQVGEFEKARELFTTRKTDLDRFRLALLHLSPEQEFSNMTKGRVLLEEYLKDNSHQDEELVSLARLLEQMAAQREGLARQLAKEKKKSETLAHQLKELKNIENIMKNREVDALPGM